MNTQSFIEGFLLGLGASVPLGPINILIISNALRSYLVAVSIGAGAMSADITYLLLALFGLFFLFKSSLITLVMALFGSIFLLYLSFEIFKHRRDTIHIKEVNSKSIFKSWLKGYSLTLLNPYTVIFWLSVSTYISTKNLEPLSTLLGLFSAITLWITLMPLAIYWSKHLFSQRVIELFSTISSIILASFAIGMFLNLTKI